MTTSHRPQLEARSGAKTAGYTPTSTEHARLVTGHKKVKYRSGRLNKNHPDDEETEKNYLEDELLHTNDDQSNDLVEESEDESSDDEVMLLQELNRLKQQRKETEEEAEEVNQNLKPVVTDQDEPKKPKKSWRQGTTFSRNTTKKSENKVSKSHHNYTNNITKSDYHQEFMKKFVK